MNHEETAKRIVAIMEACGLSIRDAAAAFGVSANTVVRLKGVANGSAEHTMYFNTRAHLAAVVRVLDKENASSDLYTRVALSKDKAAMLEQVISQA